MLDIYEGNAGHEVRHHNDDRRFNPRSKDIEIIRTLYEEDPNWIFVGGDGKILRNKVELAVLAECNLTYLIFNSTWCNKPIQDTCWMIVKGWPKITSELERLKTHSIVELKYNSAGALDIRGATASFKLKAR